MCHAVEVYTVFPSGVAALPFAYLVFYQWEL